MTGDDYEAIAALVQGVVAAAIPAIARAVREELQRQDRRALPEGVSDFDRDLARIVEAIWRDQGRRPATTRAVSMRCGYSLSHTRRLLQDAEQAGAVASVPRRGRRHSGRWLPVAVSAGPLESARPGNVMQMF